MASSSIEQLQGELAALEAEYERMVPQVAAANQNLTRGKAAAIQALGNNGSHTIVSALVQVEINLRNAVGALEAAIASVKAKINQLAMVGGRG